MSDWRTRSSDVVRTLGSIQRHLLDTCSDNLHRLVNAQVDSLWDEGVHATEYLIRASLKAQADMATLLTDQFVSLWIVPPPVAEATENAHAIFQDLTITEAGILINMGDFVRLFDPFRAARFARRKMKRSHRRVQDMSREAIEQQLDLISGWTCGPNGTHAGNKRGIATAHTRAPRRTG